jgi:hypothetical protein
MPNTVLWSFRHPAALIFTVSVCLSPAPSVLAQVMPGAGSNPSHDTSKTPFRIKLSGFINTKPEGGSAAVVTLGINTYGETYQFEVVKAEAVDDSQVGQHAILQQVRKYQVDFNLIGPQELLSKVGQAEPGTPLAIVGFFRQYNRTLQLVSVDVIGMTD